jgi:hypothetical protein
MTYNGGVDAPVRMQLSSNTTVKATTSILHATIVTGVMNRRPHDFHNSNSSAWPIANGSGDQLCSVNAASMQQI